jgi:hypothetical protein
MWYCMHALDVPARLVSRARVYWPATLAALAG